MTSGVAHAFQVLAEAVPLAALVFVPATIQDAANQVGSDRVGASPMTPRVLWHNGRADVRSLEPLLGDGSATSGATHDNSSVIMMVINADDPAIAGTLAAVRNPGGRWSDADQALVRMSAAMLMPALLESIDSPHRAGRRRPTSGNHDDLDVQREQLRAAVDRGELVLQYQPELDMRTGQILAVEALVRWDHPQRGRLSPDAFIEQAEHSDVIKVLGRWVIDQALREFAGWHNDRVSLRINISPAQLSGEGIVDRLASALRENHVAGRQVCVEFTETATRGDPAELAATLEALAALGITSAIDDLATGYSTLARLRTLPVDTVKIDRSLVTGIDTDPRARAIVGALVGMALELGTDTVAEGIETAAEARTLVALGCVRGQGHYFARPMDAAAIPVVLRTGIAPPR